jgi:hypothetical protein
MSEVGDDPEGCQVPLPPDGSAYLPVLYLGGPLPPNVVYYLPAPPYAVPPPCAYGYPPDPSPGVQFVPLPCEGRDSRLFHVSGVPSFAGFSRVMRPGCCGDAERTARLRRAEEAIRSDAGLAAEDRLLAIRMLTYFEQFGNTRCRNVALGLAIVFMLAGLIVTFALDSGLRFAFGIGFFVAALYNIGVWGLGVARERKCAKELQERERAALARHARA